MIPSVASGRPVPPPASDSCAGPRTGISNFTVDLLTRWTLLSGRNTLVSPRMVFREAVRTMASSVILVHNHPSGDPTPSDADVLLTHRMVRVGATLGIPVVDHIVLGKGFEARSMAHMGFLSRDHG